MADLIPMSEISTLKPASEVKSVADEAVEIQEKNAAARLINLAANAGQHVAIWEHPMSDTLKETLQGQGYIVTQQPMAADPTVQYRIEGF